MQGKKTYSEKLFTSFQLSDWVSEDNVYRKLKDRLDLKWVYAATRTYYGTEGQQSIDPIVFFKLILIGYLENINSDRKIVEVASMRMDMLFFIGYDLGERLPWHSTLSRTRQLYGEEVFKQLFRHVLKQCIDQGMVAGCRQAVDSALIKANASMDSLGQAQVLQDADEYADHLSQQDQAEQHASLKPPAQKKAASPRSSTDPDARLATKPGKPYQLYYLSQVSADTASHVITHIAAHHADKRDSQCLAEVVDEASENLGAQGLIIEEVLADTNYSSGDSLKYLQENNIEGYIPNCGQYKATRSGFRYDEQTDSFICEQGVGLRYAKTYKTTEGRWKKVYSSSRQDCQSCPMKAQCIGKSTRKRLTTTTDKPLYDLMHKRMQSEKAKRMRKLRQSTVEPILGSLINFNGMRRLNTRGIQQASKCMLMAAVSYNLKKLLKFKGPSVNAAIKTLKKLPMNIQKIENGVRQAFTNALKQIESLQDRNNQQPALLLESTIAIK